MYQPGARREDNAKSKDIAVSGLPQLQRHAQPAACGCLKAVLDRPAVKLVSADAGLSSSV